MSSINTPYDSGTPRSWSCGGEVGQPLLSCCFGEKLNALLMSVVFVYDAVGYGVLLSTERNFVIRALFFDPSCRGALRSVLSGLLSA